MSNEINKVRTNNILYDIRDTSKQDLLIPGNNITIENNVISATTEPYVLPMAGSNILGGVKIGENINIDNTGRISSGLSSLPSPTVELVGKVVQYVGENTTTLRKGYFYKCVNNNGTLSWEATYTQTPTFITCPAEDYTLQNPLDLDLFEPGTYTIPIKTTWNSSFSIPIKGTIEGVSLSGTISSMNTYDFASQGISLQVIRPTRDVTKTNNIIAVFKRTLYQSDGTIRIYPMKVYCIYSNDTPALLSGAPNGFHDMLKAVTIDAAQTVTSKKTFNVLPESSVVPTTDDQLVNKKYVDTRIIFDSGSYENPYILSELKAGIYICNGGFWCATAVGGAPHSSIDIEGAGSAIPVWIYLDRDLIGVNVGTTVGKCRFYISTRDNRLPAVNPGMLYTVNLHLGQSGLYIEAYSYSTWGSANPMIITSLDQTIRGAKTFGEDPKCGQVPTDSKHLTNKKYVDDYPLMQLGLSEYSNTVPYAVGNYIYYNSEIYRCNTAIPDHENWNPLHWDAIPYIDYLGNLICGNALGGSY